MIRPKKTNYAKSQRGRLKAGNSINCARKGCLPTFGDYALFSLESGYLQGKHLEAGRRAIRQGLNRKGNLYINAFAHKAFTKKPVGVRIGKGKGNVSFWACKVIAGKVIYEISGVSFEVAKRAFQKAKKKLPLKMQISSFKKPLVLINKRK